MYLNLNRSCLRYQFGQLDAQLRLKDGEGKDIGNKMWIIMNKSFLSIVEHPKNKKFLMVRARKKEDILQVFPKCKIWESSKRDYQWRTFLLRREVAIAIGNNVLRINYSNFKNSVLDENRKSAYTEIWWILLNWAKPIFLRQKKNWNDNFTGEQYDRKD